MNKKYKIILSDKEREEINDVLRRGNHSSQKFTRARAMLLSSEGKQDLKIASTVGLTSQAVVEIRKRFVRKGFECTLHGASRSGRPVKMAERVEAYAIATACSETPTGRKEWTMQLIADRLVELKLVDSISDETVRIHLKKKDKALAT
jgi:putative transposase